MRISPEQKEAIISAITRVDKEAGVWLFGSRVDDSKKGGDIDIAVLSKKIGVMEKIRIKRSICTMIGEQKIDLMVSNTGQEAFFQFVIDKGIKLA